MKKFLLLPVVLAVGFGILILLNTEPPGNNKEKEEQSDTFPGTEGDFVKAESGLKYRDEKTGDGKEAASGDTVVVHYTGWLTDGTKFDSSRDRKKPIDFKLRRGDVIDGWVEGVAGMKVGGKRILLIPPDLGYKARGQGSIPPNATLVFAVELVDVK
ncbi:MAG TPA: FKBP-type peptidyl-prolyl cis-trans isomerase [Gemmataceae bacterium]|nr:FKBP-type peptidyl-prolyl cis-trans isomerase [Gemmataceae bacterium]